MTTPLSHDEAFAMLPELALGMLPADEAARVMAYVATSPECQAELASLRGAAGALSASAPAAPMAPARKSAMRDRLLARASSGSSSDATGSADVIAPPVAITMPAAPSTPTLRLEPRDPRPSSDVVRPAPAARPGAIARIAPWFAAAASLGIALQQVQSGRRVAAERDAAQSALQAATATTTQLSSKLAASDSLVSALTGAQVSVVELASTAKLPPGARMFWDRVTNRWTLITHDLTPAQSGRVYQLWLVTAKAEKISAGTFNTDAQGRAVVQATYALAAADLAAIAITEEPEGGSPQPTGAILVAGAPTR
jgi:anti-sigma-K factor RskA